MNHKKGGPAGELMLFWSVIKGLNSIKGVSVQFVKSIANLKDTLAAPADDFTFLFIDQYGLDDVKRSCKQSGAGGKNVYPEWKCRIRMLDFWGTPANQNHEKLNSLQFVVPYPHFARLWQNYFLGFLPATELMALQTFDKECGVVQDQESGWTFKPKPAKHQAVLYGKMDKYFKQAEGLIRKISKLVCCKSIK